MADVDLVMTDHPAWMPANTGEGKMRVLVGFGGRWLVRTGGSKAFTLQQLARATVNPLYDVFSLPPGVLDEVPQLADSLAQLGNVARFRAGNPWDALGTAAIAQMLRAAHGARLYRQLCQAHGHRLQLPTGDDYPLFPTAEAVLDLSREEFEALGLGSKRGLLRDAATSYLQHQNTWEGLSPLRLVDELRRIPRVGRWTAQAAAADLTNDWSLYPAGDLSLRRLAGRAAPDHPWPVDERGFANYWRGLTGPHLGLITVLTLAWGNQQTAHRPTGQSDSEVTR